MKLKVILIGAVAIAVVMAVTNPSKDRYAEYAAEEFIRTGKTTFCNDLPSQVQQQCKLGMSLLTSQGKPLIKNFIDRATKHQNFVLLSIYETDMPNRKLTTIAAFGNFYMFK